jgi:iron complex outermembrane recepter protein
MSRMFGRFALALAASVSMLPLAAQAQDTPTDEEIVVTATKREELLREVPQSVTAVTGDTLERLQADSFEDYVGRVPGMVATGDQPGNTRLVLRGINNEGIGASVGTYVDETPFGSSSGLVNAAALALDLDPFDIERVEVLRGPQGTLYGATALAGLIRFVTRDPSSEAFEFRVRATGESTEEGEASWTGRVAANIPMGDQAGLRISGFQRSTGGYVDGVRDNNESGTVDAGDTVFEDYNPIESSGARATFLVEPTDDVSIRLSAMVQDIVSDNFNTVQYDAPGGEVGSPTHGDLISLGADFDNISDTAYHIYNGTVNWDFGWANLTSSTSYSELDQYRLLGDNLVSGIRQDNNVLQDKTTQEVRLTSPSSDRLEWQVGAFYTTESGLVNQVQDFQFLLESLGFTPVLAFILGITEAEVLEQAHIQADLVSEYQETALFGNVTYHFSPQFDVNVGLRQARNEQEFDQIITHTSVSPFLVPIGNASQDSTEDVTTFSISPRWRPNDNTMIYARIANGYRAGGPNVGVIGSLAIPPAYDSDTTINYELGIKTDLTDTLRLDATVFRIDWSDIQLLVAEVVGSQLVSGNANGGEAISQGLEWAATWRPMDGLNVVWTGAYTDAHLSSDPPAASALVMADGDRIPFTPEWSSSVDVDYEWTAFGTTNAYVGGGVRYVSDQMSNFATIFDPPPAQIELPSHTVVDLRAGLDFERFDIEVFARNVTDDRGPTRMGPTPDSGDAAVLRPRTIGVTLTAEF